MAWSNNSITQVEQVSLYMYVWCTSMGPALKKGKHPQQASIPSIELFGIKKAKGNQAKGTH